MKSVKIKIGQSNIDLFEDEFGFMAERFIENNNAWETWRWFVLHQEKNLYILQENIENGDIVELGVYNNLPEGLANLACAEKKRHLIN